MDQFWEFVNVVGSGVIIRGQLSQEENHYILMTYPCSVFIINTYSCWLLFFVYYVLYYICLFYTFKTTQSDGVPVGPWCLIPTYTCLNRLIHTLKLLHK